MNKYQSGKIYKIIDNTSNMVYVGSTYKTLQQRLNGHEQQFKTFKAGKHHYITSFKILENNNYKIELIESFPCETKQELNKREGNILIELRNKGLNVINRCIAGLTRKESDDQYRKKKQGYN